MEALALPPIPTTTTLTVPPKRTLTQVATRFEHIESFHNPDADLRLHTLRMSEDGLVEIPGLGRHLLNEVSRAQIAKSLGFTWDKFFEGARVPEQADELNRRLARARGFVRLRTTRKTPEGTAADGVLRAVVSPSYTPISDSWICAALEDALATVEPDAEVIRYHAGDLTSGLLVRIGEPFEPKKGTPVGSINGTLALRNSGVAFAKLTITLQLFRLSCSNGLALPIAGATIFSHRHRGLGLAEIRAALLVGLDGIRDRIYQGAAVMGSSIEVEVDDVEAEVRGLLRGAHLPAGLLPSVLGAYRREPHPTRFGVSQALTLAAQNESPETRYEMETAAGEYLRRG